MTIVGTTCAGGAEGSDPAAQQTDEDGDISNVVDRVERANEEVSNGAESHTIDAVARDRGCDDDDRRERNPEPSDQMRRPYREDGQARQRDDHDAGGRLAAKTEHQLAVAQRTDQRAAHL